jgi:flagellin-specific chaperone FliS
MINKSRKNIYKQAQRFADVTKELIATGNMNRARKCLQKAEDIFISGSEEVQNAISNIYLYSVSCFMETHHCNIKSLLPSNLQNEYYKQVNAPGI